MCSQKPTRRSSRSKWGNCSEAGKRFLVPLSLLDLCLFPNCFLPWPLLVPAQEFHNTQMQALVAMANYCTFTPKFHQWVHMGRPLGKFSSPGFFSQRFCEIPNLRATCLRVRYRGVLPPGLARTPRTTAAGSTRATTGRSPRWQLLPTAAFLKSVCSPRGPCFKAKAASRSSEAGRMCALCQCSSQMHPLPTHCLAKITRFELQARLQTSSLRVPRRAALSFGDLAGCRGDNPNARVNVWP